MAEQVVPAPILNPQNHEAKPTCSLPRWLLSGLLLQEPKAALSVLQLNWIPVIAQTQLVISHTHTTFVPTTHVWPPVFVFPALKGGFIASAKPAGIFPSITSLSHCGIKARF